MYNGELLVWNGTNYTLSAGKTQNTIQCQSSSPFEFFRRRFLRFLCRVAVFVPEYDRLYGETVKIYDLFFRVIDNADLTRPGIIFRIVGFGRRPPGNIIAPFGNRRRQVPFFRSPDPVPFRDRPDKTVELFPFQPEAHMICTVQHADDAIIQTAGIIRDRDVEALKLIFNFRGGHYRFGIPEAVPQLTADVTGQPRSSQHHKADREQPKEQDTFFPRYFHLCLHQLVQILCNHHPI